MDHNFDNKYLGLGSGTSAQNIPPPSLAFGLDYSSFQFEEWLQLGCINIMKSQEVRAGL